MLNRLYAAVLFAALVASSAFAGDNQFKPLEKGQAMVLIRLTEPHKTRAELTTEALASSKGDAFKRDPAALAKFVDRQICKEALSDVDIAGGNFDPASQRVTANSFVGRLSFTVVDDETTGDCWLVGQVNVGHVVLTQTALQTRWRILYHQSQTFEVKPGSYNFIGTLDRRYGAQRIVQAIQSGRMRSMTQKIETIHGDLEGFAPNTVAADGQVAAAAFLSRKWARPVQVDAPAVTPTSVAY